MVFSQFSTPNCKKLKSLLYGRELLTTKKTGAGHVRHARGALPEEQMPSPLHFHSMQTCVHLIDQNRWQSG